MTPDTYKPINPLLIIRIPTPSPVNNRGDRADSQKKKKVYIITCVTATRPVTRPVAAAAQESTPSRKTQTMPRVAMQKKGCGIIIVFVFFHLLSSFIPPSPWFIINNKHKPNQPNPKTPTTFFNASSVTVTRSALIPRLQHHIIISSTSSLAHTRTQKCSSIESSPTPSPPPTATARPKAASPSPHSPPRPPGPAASRSRYAPKPSAARCSQ